MEINAGRQYVQTVSVPGRPEDVIQQLTSGLAGVPGYTMIQSGPNSITFTRSFIPQWAFIGGIIAGLLTCVGFLLLLMKEEELLMVTATASGDGTRLDITGAASGAMTNRLSGMTASLGGQVAAPPAMPAAPPAMPALPPPCPRLPPPCPRLPRPSRRPGRRPSPRRPRRRRRRRGTPTPRAAMSSATGTARPGPTKYWTRARPRRIPPRRSAPIPRAVR